jgi:hypothetical protein
MARTCTVCVHKRRQAIEEDLLSGTGFRNIVERYQITMGSLHRHKEHISQSLMKAHEAGEVLHGDALVDHVRELRQRSEDLYLEAERILDQAKRARNLKGAIEAIKCASGVLREGRGNASLLGQLTGELNTAPNVGITVVMPVPSAERNEDPLDEPAVINIGQFHRG